MNWVILYFPFGIILPQVRILQSWGDNNYQLRYLIPYLTYENAKGQKARVDSMFQSQASSVMDYIKLSDGEQWTPGSYDIAAIQFYLMSSK